MNLIMFFLNTKSILSHSNNLIFVSYLLFYLFRMKYDFLMLKNVHLFSKSFHSKISIRILFCKFYSNWQGILYDKEDISYPFSRFPPSDSRNICSCLFLDILIEILLLFTRFIELKLRCFFYRFFNITKAIF